MSEFNRYAARLNTAFATASMKQKQALENYRDAENALKTANTPAEKIDAEAAVKKAKAELDDVQRHTWPEFQQTRDALGRELEKEVNDTRAADPDAFDPNAAALLNSDLMTAADLHKMAEKYADNPTMTRMIGQKAGKMADEIGDKDPAARRDLTALSYNCTQPGRPAALEAWDKICNASKHYSGEMTRNADPEYICKVNEHWTDDSVQAAIKEF